MRKFLQNKLWRDRTPEKLEKMGSVIHTIKLNDEEYDYELRIKLLEEVQEVKKAQSKQELIEELADVFEVIDALRILHSISQENVKTVQEKKRNERGGFAERTFVTIADHIEGSFGEKYCLEQPEKYPEVT